jgi:hypothetical protein
LDGSKLKGVHFIECGCVAVNGVVGVDAADSSSATDDVAVNKGENHVRIVQAQLHWRNSRVWNC